MRRGARFLATGIAAFSMPKRAVSSPVQASASCSSSVSRMRRPTEIPFVPSFADRPSTTTARRRPTSPPPRSRARRGWCSAPARRWWRRFETSVWWSSTKSTTRRSSRPRASATRRAISRSCEGSGPGVRYCWARPRHHWRACAMRWPGATGTYVWIGAPVMRRARRSACWTSVTSHCSRGSVIRCWTGWQRHSTVVNR